MDEVSVKDKGFLSLFVLKMIISLAILLPPAVENDVHSN